MSTLIVKNYLQNKDPLKFLGLEMGSRIIYENNNGDLITSLKVKIFFYYKGSFLARGVIKI